MNEKTIELILCAMQAEYDDQSLNRILELLKGIYETDDIKLVEDVSRFPKDCGEYSDYSYLPIKINGEMKRFFKIKNVTSCFARLRNDSFSKVLSQMYSNIVKYEGVANYDIATNVLNRNAYERFIEKFNCEEYQSFGCVFVDINDLCEINDNHGHKVGDDVIKKVASLIKGSFGTFVDAQIFRTGGDEFVIFLPDVVEQNLSDKIVLIENPLEYVVEETGEKIQISVSIGTSIASGSIDITKVIERADDAMYKAKRAYHEKSGTPMRKKRGCNE